jgi:hypothetical protein
LQFRYHEVPTLPRLAWCARVTAGTDVVPLFHGAWVETSAAGFVEGAWNGAFEAFDLAAATVICGTAGTAATDHVRFFASTDQHGVLFSVRQGSTLFVSNSPAFVLTACDDAPDPIYPFYPYDLLAIFRQGLYCPDGRIRLRSGGALHVHYTTALSVSRQGEVRFHAQAPCAPPDDYRAYEALLHDGVGAILANGRDAQRRHPFSPLVALSRGYDSTAAAVLARRVGAPDADTNVDSRQDDPARDSGAANARALGLACTEYDRWAYLAHDRLAEAEFGYAPLSSTVPLTAVEEQLAGRVLVTGESGDPVWDPRRARVFERMSRPWIRFAHGLGMIEHRLRTGYVAFLPSCIGALHNGALHAIAVSPEMQPWSVGGNYDRPIPRRLCEEAGLARESFGTRKLASGHSHLNDASRFSPRSLELYRSFVQQSHATVAAQAQRRWRARARLRQRAWDLLRPRQRYVRSNRLRRSLPFLLNAPPIPIPWAFMFTFQWTVATLRDRYRLPAQSTAPSQPQERRPG